MFHHLLVDEFQDINDLQYRLIQAWGRKCFPVCHRRSGPIHLWLPAVPVHSAFARFASDHPALHSVHLSETSGPRQKFFLVPCPSYTAKAATCMPTASDGPKAVLS